MGVPTLQSLTASSEGKRMYVVPTLTSVLKGLEASSKRVSPVDWSLDWPFVWSCLAQIAMLFNGA